MDIQLVGDGTGNERAVSRCRVTEHRYLAFQQMLPKECPVVFLSHSFQHHAEKIIICHNHPRLGGITLHMLHPFRGLKIIHQAISHHHRNGFVGFQSIEMSDGNIGTQAHHLVSYFMLEANDHRHRYNHYGQADSDAPCSNENGRFRNLFLSFFATINTAGYKEFPIHLS